MKKLILPILLILSFSASYAQQDPLYAQYINNPMVINPGYTGINNVLNASLSYRSQWTGFGDGAPNTASFAAHSSFFDDLVGLGLIVVRDEVGVNVNTQFSLAAAYHIEFEETEFAFGMQAGVLSFRENNSELLTPVNDPVFAADQTFSKFNIGAGIVIKNPKYYVGLSVPRLLDNTEELEGISQQLYQRHYYLGLGYFININSDLGFKPTALIKAVPDAPASVDLNASLVIRDKYSAGLLTRNFNTYGLIAQINFNHNLRIGYVAEVPTNNSVGSQFTSHEISITLDMEVFDFHFLDERQF